MVRALRRFLLIGCIAALLVGSGAVADELPEPGVVVIKTGALTAELQRRHFWNLQRLSYRGVEVAGPTGAWGTVISVPAIGGWVGSGHTQGCVERIEEVTLTVDGEQVPLDDGAVYACDRAVLVKRSMLDKVRLETTFTFADETITQSVSLTATEDVAVTTVYPFIHCLSPDTSEWFALTWDNEEAGGEFTGSDELAWHSGWAWTAAYIPGDQTGFLLRDLMGPRDREVKMGYWDQERYHKLYVSAPPPEETWREGVSVEWAVRIACFEAPPDVWKQRANRLAPELIAE